MSATPITLQIALPADVTLSPAELLGITGREHLSKQIKWLDEQGWSYTLSADRGLLVGKLYAHLRLAGLHPVDVARQPVDAGGFNLNATR